MCILYNTLCYFFVKFHMVFPVQIHEFTINYYFVIVTKQIPCIFKQFSIFSEQILFVCKTNSSFCCKLFPRAKWNLIFQKLNSIRDEVIFFAESKNLFENIESLKYVFKRLNMKFKKNFNSSSLLRHVKSLLSYN